jgi:hypothetical protein
MDIDIPSFLVDLIRPRDSDLTNQQSYHDRCQDSLLLQVSTESAQFAVMCSPSGRVKYLNEELDEYISLLSTDIHNKRLSVYKQCALPDQVCRLHIRLKGDSTQHILAQLPAILSHVGILYGQSVDTCCVMDVTFMHTHETWVIFQLVTEAADCTHLVSYLRRHMPSLTFFQPDQKILCIPFIHHVDFNTCGECENKIPDKITCTGCNSFGSRPIHERHTTLYLIHGSTTSRYLDPHTSGDIELIETCVRATMLRANPALVVYPISPYKELYRDSFKHRWMKIQFDTPFEEIIQLYLSQSQKPFDTLRIGNIYKTPRYIYITIRSPSRCMISEAPPSVHNAYIRAHIRKAHTLELTYACKTCGICDIDMPTSRELLQNYLKYTGVPLKN